MKQTIFILLCLYAAISPVVSDIYSCKYEYTTSYRSSMITEDTSGYLCTLSIYARNNRANQINGNHQYRRGDNSIKIIKISQNSQPHLTSFPTIFCNKFRNLAIIDMCDVYIRTIEDESLSQCQNLEILQFYKNKIEALPENWLTENKKLQKLFLKFNYIKRLPVDFFAGLTKLTVLDLSSNKIDHLSSDVFDDLNSLKELKLEGNKLKELNRNLFRKIKNLETLNLNRNEISELPQGLFSNLNSIKNLFIDSNKLTIIQAASFPQNAQISIISFSHNKINAIDEAFISNCRVGSLNMAGNVCERDAEIRSFEMRQKLQNCFRNYRNLLGTRKPTTTLDSSKQLKPWIPGCGKTQVGAQTIIGGTKVDKGTHPWIAALVNRTNGYFCGGTLITKRLVLTAAHCILDKQHEMKPADLTVLLGAHQLDNPFDIGKRSYGVNSIHLHDDWNQHTVKFDADIAVLKLSADVTFGTYIQPVCLAIIGKNLENYNDGVIVGFGRTEYTTTHSNVPMKASTPIRKSDDCYNEFPALNRIASHRTFCGGLANGTGACLGDSGSGLTVVENEIHYLRGIVSGSLRDQKYGCDVNSYSIFTDMRFYLNFVRPFNY